MYFCIFVVIYCIFFAIFTLFAALVDASVGRWSDWPFQAALFNCLSVMQNSRFRRNHFTNKLSM